MQCVRFMTTFFRELQLAARSLAKSPTLALVAISTLAIGIGANTAVFTLAHAVLLAPLPYEEPDRVVRVLPEAPVSAELFDHVAETADSYGAVAIAVPTAVSLTGEGRPQEVEGVRVSPGYFDVLGVETALGTKFDDGARLPGNDRVAILGHGLWQRRFGGDPGIVGRTVLLGKVPHTVVGVLPDSFDPLHEGSEVWLPVAVDRGDEAYWDWIAYAMYGRLQDGATAASAGAELNRALASYEEIRPGYLSNLVGTGTVRPLLEHLTGDVQTTFLLLSVGVGLVLLIGCANLANLLLARLTARRHELALRSALGAGTWRLMGHVLAESLLLALVGGLAGVEAAWWSMRALVELLAGSMPRVVDAEVEGRVLLFAFALAAVTALLVGALPALRASRVDPRAQLSASPRASSPRRHRLNHTLVAAEVALAVVLVAGTGLLVKSFATVSRVELGFDPERLLTLQISAPDSYPEGPERGRYFEEVLERVRAVPGVASAAAMNRPPMTPGDVGIAFSPQGMEMPPGMRSVSVRLVSPGFAEALGMPIVAGRALSQTDREETPPVGLINRAMARRLWGDDDPIGTPLVFEGTDQVWFTVVGVVGDIKQHSLDRDTEPQVYRPIGQAAWEPRMTLLVRSTIAPEALVPGIEEAVWSIAPDVPVSRVATMDALIDRTLRGRKVLVTLFTGFGVIGLVLGMVGVFGMTTYTVGQQRREHGIRLALGATSHQVVRLALLRTLAAVAVGLVGGTALSLPLGRFVESFLFGVEPFDPAVFGAVFAVLVASATVAAWLPSRRAGQVAPTEVLEAE